MSTTTEWLKERRAALKLSQAEAGLRLGLSQPQYSQLERGQGKVSSDLELKIRGAFGDGFVAEPTTDADGTKREMPEAARAALAAKRSEAFYLEIDDGVWVTADSYQYVLHFGQNNQNKSYFTEIPALIKHLITLKVRTSSISNFTDIISVIEKTYKLADEKFSSYDPAKIRQNKNDDDSEDAEASDDTSEDSE